MKEDNYRSCKQQLLKAFDRSIARSRGVLIARYGHEQAEALIREFRAEYEMIIPQIPFIGRRSPFLIFLLPTSRYLAVYRVLRRKAIATAEAGRIIFQMNEAELDAIPMSLRRIIGYVWFSPWFIRRLRKRAAESQEQRYPGSYVLTFIEGDGRTFDYGIDYTACAGCILLNQLGAPELAPFMCALDKGASEKLGWGLTRTMTIAEGHGKCDFRFKKGGKTDIIIPSSVKDACNP